MQRSTLVLSLAIVMVLGLVGTAVATDAFPDVSEGNTHHNNIGWADENGVVRGFGDGTFRPDRNITRGQAATMFAQYHDAFEPRDGQDGATGPQGPAGPAGTDGTDGEDGADGADGADGQDGADGADGAQGPPGEQGEPGEPGVANLSTDGPFPGETQLSANLDDGRANSDDYWDDSSNNVSWVRCADDKSALGGGFKAGAGAPGGASPDVSITASYPAYIDEDGEILSETDANSVRIDDTGDDWAFEPNGWVVEGTLEEGSNQIVRPFVTCANVN